ncbi:MAG TPA: F0F1 ATP synthase subunit B [Fimbriimonadaceae bacterium]|nr:F0F1 ATP synthase subunit B [Fimbriimonadaceae bacterium]
MATENNSRKLTGGEIGVKTALMIFGLILIALGYFVYGESWTTPEMFAGLGLDLSKVIVNVGFFLLFIQVINIYFYTPLREAIEERNQELETTFSEAETLKTTMAQMRSDYERRLAQTEAEAREQIQAQIKEAQQLRQTLMAEAGEKADELVKKANQEIEAEKARVMGDLRLGVVNLTLAATEKLLGENVDSAKNRRLVEEFIDKIEVKA